MMPSRTRLWHHTRLDLHLVVLLSACQIIVANCGDSRALLCRGSQAVPLTADHKVQLEFFICPALVAEMLKLATI